MKINVVVSKQEKLQEEQKDFNELSEILNCYDCNFFCEDCIYHPGRDAYSLMRRYNLTSKLQCPKFQKRLMVVKTLLNFLFLPLLFFFGFGTFKFLIGTIFYGFIIIGFDKLTDDFLIKYYENVEIKRRQEYDDAIKKIKDEKMTDEECDFFTFAETLYKSLSEKYEEIVKSKALLNISNGKRVEKKFEEVLIEFENLNKKLSEENIRTSYIKTLYNLHIVKLIEISVKFIELLKLNEVTDEQVKEFSNLLEVFRKKISDNQIYLQEKAEQDFIIKMQALNDDVDSTYSGNSESEEKLDE